MCRYGVADLSCEIDCPSGRQYGESGGVYCRITIIIPEEYVFGTHDDCSIIKWNSQAFIIIMT